MPDDLALRAGITGRGAVGREVARRLLDDPMPVEGLERPITRAPAI